MLIQSFSTRTPRHIDMPNYLIIIKVSRRGVNIQAAVEVVEVEPEQAHVNVSAHVEFHHIVIGQGLNLVMNAIVSWI